MSHTELTNEEIQRVASKAFADPVYFCRFFLEHWFPLPMPWVHRGLLAILTRKCEFLLKYGDLEKIERNFVWHDENGEEHRIFDLTGPQAPRMFLGKYTVVLLPRGFSKTTLANSVSIYETVFLEEDYFAYVSESGTHARAQTNNVRHELAYNDRIRAIFGNLKPAQRKDDAKWSEDFFETTSGVAMVARGRGAQIRGLLHKGRRPGKIIIDDFEDSESVATEDQRDKTKHSFFGDIKPALPRVGNGSITMLGTMLHPEALLTTLVTDPQWTAIVFGAIDRDGELLWPEGLSAEEIQAEKRSYANANQLHIFYMEYFNEIRPPENASFKPHYIQHEPIPQEEVPYQAIVIDPAISQRLGADYTAIVVVGMQENGRIVVLECWAKQGASPREQINKYFELAKAYDISHECHGVESIAYQKALVHLLREEMFRQHYYFEPVKIEGHDQRKDDRIQGILQPRYAGGYVVHTRKFPELETQLLDFPNGKKDCPDALAMAVKLLDPFASMAYDDGEGGDPGEDEYEPIEDIIGDWRS